ncbi:MAG: acyl-CoA dehydrogenase family protein [Desulfobacterales bacterium]|nr:acyl-CoA dehydrogenase family protein [Desulfobacterales bacterium]
MDFTIPEALSKDLKRFKQFLKDRIQSNLPEWYQRQEISAEFFRQMGAGHWYGIESKSGNLIKSSALREALIAEELAKISPGLAVAALVHIDLGLIALYLSGSDRLKSRYGQSAAKGETLLCVGNTERMAGSDSAGIEMQARKVKGGWLLNGTKAYVTNGYISDLAAITAVSDPAASRNNRISMYLVDLKAKDVKRKKLNKQVWIPSDLTRLQFNDVFVPDDHLIGSRGQGLQQVLTVFTYSRVPIAAMTLGTAVGAFELALAHAKKRRIFGQPITEFQAKAFEAADFYAKIEAARLMLWKACWKMDRNEDFRQESSLAKYLAVEITRSVTTWAADIFGAASVIQDHPIHKFPMDAWASSLGEGTQDVQKLVIFRELMKQYG